ncbi:16S rRNA (adenine(1518)-N(6)/adenine(1519)-N(6))-dimethyltransferase RsmA [Wenzhouxiangella sp. AB-CW3]|uniref:16S rRNA (adenine(1518)-N(6)/adenine(1519)-N(6))- dimethyltransferase RsmA n=1 Tax=Wenzhouxiangella sp. AB-CW3 TaxID=2771012 RepID=UPI00168C08B6|nr:16S rRNA (adenine(1518)-N(6)/adenine(1519)-N(6))-dimethyltransferase RsmA [Wenzhouxiangella sp. AB-CW3]QOC22930.1 16S rRNA (adenine(1518)-N(6)/adenine(1519)-N(6))-dimethyltransferase RsmA [Wenzhouxiangella sp. AB-CW3]
MNRHRPRKRFGQHFLHDANIVSRLVRAIAPGPDDHLIEIGPGEGVLTAPLLEHVRALTAIELDRDLAATLGERLGHPDGLTVIQADVLTVDLVELAPDRPVRIVGNLPYNISTPILFHLFDSQADIADMHFMLQKEVVDRMVAGPGSRQYGRLSVMAAFHCDMTRLFNVPPGAFRPPPKVDSAIVRLAPRALSESDRTLLPAFTEVARRAFGQRRKTLRNSLKGLLDAEQIKAAGIDPGARAETLSMEQFRKLAEEVKGKM